MITTFSSREFNRDVTKAKKATQHGPVFITTHGQVAHVLLSIDEFQRLSSKGKSIADTLAMPCTENIEFEAPRSDFAGKKIR